MGSIWLSFERKPWRDFNFEMCYGAVPKAVNARLSSIGDKGETNREWRRPVAHPALIDPSDAPIRAGGRSRSLQAVLFAAILIAAAVWVPDRLATAVLFTAGVTVAATVAVRMLLRSRRGADPAAAHAVSAFLEHDASPSFTTDADGLIRYRNGSAAERFGPPQPGEPESLSRALRDLFANPAALLTRLQARAEARGAAREDLVTRKGHVRLAVHRISADCYLWRLEDLVERSGGGRGAESLSLPMMTVSRTGAILFMNDALRRLLGGRVKTLDRIFSDLPLRPGEDHVVQTAEGPAPVRVIEADGTAGRREIFLVPAGAAGGPTLRAEAAPECEAGSVALDAVPVALVRMDREGQLVEINRAARGLLGPSAVPGASLAGLVEGLGRSVRDWLEEAVAAPAPVQPEVVRASRRDSEVYLQITLGRERRGDAVGLLAVLGDATELKTLEAQFVQSQKMQAIGQLAGGVAHDFNNLLTAISGHCDLLLLRHDSGDPDYGDLMQINQNANRAASLVRQLLAFSRKQTLQPEVLDLPETLSDLTHLLNRLVGERVSLSLSQSDQTLPIRADKRQLEQVVMNLVVNARDAMKAKGGEIRIESVATTLTEPLCRDRATVPAGDYMVIRVIDTGVGIPQDRLAKVFEPFFSTKRTGEGTGLGLSTAYGIVKQSGGFIFVDSVVGEGTTFSVYLPAHRGAPAAKAAPATAEAAVSLHKGDGVILLVEDEAPVRAFASRALRLRGYTVIEVECAEDALAMLEDDTLRVDLFLTDVVMPGMDGPTWVRKALKSRPEARVVFVSGYAEENFGDSKTGIPNSVFLPKPFSLNDLTTTVRRQIH